MEDVHPCRPERTVDGERRLEIFTHLVVPAFFRRAGSRGSTAGKMPAATNSAPAARHVYSRRISVEQSSVGAACWEHDAVTTWSLSFSESISGVQPVVLAC
jgi:hypothetical protein